MDSEPAEIEGEAAENGDTGDTGAELDDGMGDPRASPFHHGEYPVPHFRTRHSALNSRKIKTIHINRKAGSSREAADRSSGLFHFQSLT